MFIYEIYLNGKMVDVCNLEGIAIMKYQSACLIGDSMLRRVYTGDDFDPMLHFPCVFDPYYEVFDDEREIYYPKED